jgi:hypothetical protein
MTGAVERALKVQLADLPKEQIALQLQQASVIEDYLKDLRALAQRMLENDQPVPGFKLVAKRGTRQWVDEEKATLHLVNSMSLPVEQVVEAKLRSPAQIEKIVGKKEFPSELVVSVSSGNTLAPDSDPRPAVLQIGFQLKAALTKLQ